MKTKRWINSVSLSLVIFLSLCGTVHADDQKLSRIAVVVSLKIKPYMDTVSGIENILKTHGGVGWDVFFIEPDQNSDHSILIKKLKKKKVDVLMAVGPEAMRLIWSTFPGDHPVKLFSMVMKPQRVVSGNNPWCGIPLDIPAPKHLLEFKRFAPLLNRIGLIYDPDNNADFAFAASIAAEGRGIDLVHLRVHSRKDILPAFRSRRSQINALWMIPDATVISESIIPFLIKEAIASNVAVFGYNRFFNENGAALSLVRDYEAIGKHAADMAVSTIGGRPCRLEDPDYNVLINPDVLKAMGYPEDVENHRSPREALP